MKTFKNDFLNLSQENFIDESEEENDSNTFNDNNNNNNKTHN